MFTGTCRSNHLLKVFFFPYLFPTKSFIFGYIMSQISLVVIFIFGTAFTETICISLSSTQHRAFIHIHICGLVIAQRGWTLLFLTRQTQVPPVLWNPRWKRICIQPHILFFLSWAFRLIACLCM